MKSKLWEPNMEYVAGLMFSKDRSKLAMVIKNRPKWQEGLFNAIGGKIEEGEDPADCMVREFREETGVETTRLEWSYFTAIEGSWGKVYFYKMFSDKAYTVQTVEDEVIQLVNPIDLPRNIIGNLRWMIPLAMDGNVNVPEIFTHDGDE
jgi:8-oxo-dGTP diphosphatase